MRAPKTIEVLELRVGYVKNRFGKLPSRILSRICVKQARSEARSLRCPSRLASRRCPAKTRKDKAREMRGSIVDADKTEGRDHDLAHGDGGTRGLADNEGAPSTKDASRFR